MIGVSSNPYWGSDFFSFFAVLLQRIWLFGTGALSLEDLAPDEVQIVVLSILCFAAALIGVFLVLKKMVMLANSLSHTVLIGIVIAFVFIGRQGGEIHLPILFLAALLAGFLTTLLTQFFTQVIKLQEDASIGLVFTALFALGIIGVTLFTRNSHIGVEIVTGNVDALHRNDIKLMGIVALIDGALITFFFKEQVVVAFDPLFSRCIGISAVFFNYLLMVQVAATVIGGMRAVGVVLVLAFLVGPVLIARRFTSSLFPLIIFAIAIGIFHSVIGVALSRHFLSVYQMPLSTSGLIAALMGFSYFVVKFGYKRCK